MLTKSSATKKYKCKYLKNISASHNVLAVSSMYSKTILSQKINCSVFGVDQMLFNVVEYHRGRFFVSIFECMLVRLFECIERTIINTVTMMLFFSILRHFLIIFCFSRPAQLSPLFSSMSCFFYLSLDSNEFISVFRYSFIYTILRFKRFL